MTLKASAGFPQEPFDQARARLSEIGAGSETKDAWYRNVAFAETDDAKLAQALDAAQQLVEALAPAVTFHELD